MADFVTHIATSSVVGAAYGAAAYGWYEVPLSTSLLAGGLCGVSGMLPDLDSGAGRPLRESVAFAAAVVPMMLLERLRPFGLSPELLVLIGAGCYLGIRFGLAWFLKHATKHRGMFHSLPAAGVFFLVAFLLASGELKLRWYKAGGVLLGYMSHLLLDELYSLQWVRGRWKLRRSFGTALKLWSSTAWANLFTYALLAVLVVVVFFEPSWMQKVERRYAEAQAHFWQNQRERLTALEEALTQPHRRSTSQPPAEPNHDLDRSPQTVSPPPTSSWLPESTASEQNLSPSSSPGTSPPAEASKPPAQADQGSLFRWFR